MPVSPFTYEYPVEPADVDPQERTIDWLARDEGEYKQVEHSNLIALSTRELAERGDVTIALDRLPHRDCLSLGCSLPA